MIADIVVALFIIICTVVGVKRGFIRSVLQYLSTFIALGVVYLFAGNFAEFLDTNYGLALVMDSWVSSVLIPGATMLWLISAAVLFILSRLILLILDKWLITVKENLPMVNTVDRFFGMFFGLFLATVSLVIVFMLIDTFGWVDMLQLTTQSGSNFAAHLFNIFQLHLFPLAESAFDFVINAVSGALTA